MKKHIARILTAAMLLAFLCVPAGAAGSFGEITFEGYPPYSGAPTGQVTIDLAREETNERGAKYYAVAETVTVTVTPQENYSGEVNLVAVRYGNEDAATGRTDYVKMEVMTSAGTLKDVDSFDYTASKEEQYTLTAGQAYTFTITTSGCDAVEILCSRYSDFGLLSVATLRYDGAAAPAEPETPTRTAFTDVAATAYYYDSVQWALEREITTGTTATTFSPNDTCTTAQILTFLWRALGRPAPTIANPFSDVADTAYYSQSAAWAYEKGLVSGATFDGGEPCTRGDTVTYLWKLAGQPAAAASPFTDVDAAAEYAQAVAWAVEQKITSGTSDTTFSPDDTCTRGQIVTFLYRDLA